jgi:hypothetical protein
MPGEMAPPGAVVIPEMMIGILRTGSHRQARFLKQMKSRCAHGDYSSVSSISAQGVGPDCVPSLEKPRASLVLIFSADQRVLRSGVKRIVFFVVLFWIVVLIASLVWVEVAHRDRDNKKAAISFQEAAAYSKSWR